MSSGERSSECGARVAGPSPSMSCTTLTKSSGSVILLTNSSHRVASLGRFRCAVECSDPPSSRVSRLVRLLTSSRLAWRVAMPKSCEKPRMLRLLTPWSNSTATVSFGITYPNEPSGAVSWICQVALL